MGKLFADLIARLNFFAFAAPLLPRPYLAALVGFSTPFRPCTHQPLLPDRHPERPQRKYPSNMVAIKVMFPQFEDRIQL